jgi:DNA (cytosine-5)-methyltransferase 1
MFRLVCEVKPRWVVAENVPGLLSSDDGRFFGNILRDLAGAGYDAEWGVLSAAGVGAPHLRRRVFIVADAERSERRPLTKGRDEPNRNDAGREETSGRIGERGQEMADPSRELLDRSGRERDGGPEPSNGGWWAIEPDVCRVAHGIPARVDRLRCLGNAVVPQVAQKVGEMILGF